MNKMAKEFNKSVNEAIRPFVELATRIVKDFKEADMMEMEKNMNRNGVN